MENPKIKISVLCASRNNTNGLRTVIGALDMLKSRQHEVQYMVSGDTDDKDTIDTIVGMNFSGMDVYGCCSERTPSLGAKWNKAASTLPGDVYAIITDRACPVTPFWDNVIADAVEKDANRITWWTTNAGPVIPIVPKKWYEAAGNQIFTDYFPFWFDDTWLHELSAMVHGLPNYLVQASCFIYKKSPVTKRLRDLRFWMDFFIAKRPERIMHACEIRSKLGLPMPDIKPVEEWYKGTDVMWEQKWKMWEEVMGDKSEPDTTYLAAKKSAEEFMNANRA